MGLTHSTVGAGAMDFGLMLNRSSPDDKVIALAGNPNVGKSTVFNAFTGLNQHTGNWAGKTVASAQGVCEFGGKSYIMVDIPGTYSLMAHSKEEEVARNFICFGKPDAVVVVCDATCLERNMNLVLQTIEISPKTIVCVNLMDEAERKNIKIDLALISERLGVPVVGTSARKKPSLRALMKAVNDLAASEIPRDTYKVRYCDALERAIALLEGCVSEKCRSRLCARWLSQRLLDADEALLAEINAYLGEEFLKDDELQAELKRAKEELLAGGIADADALRDMTVSALVTAAHEICSGAVEYQNRLYAENDRRLDRILTGRRAGVPVMLLLLALVFYITITCANYPSELIASGLFWIEERLTELFNSLGAPDWLHGALVLGVYRVLAWVVSVMLPPMAIFFPLFTLLEDAGYLPRVAYNLDKPFKRCNACGKQALCMCMGFGCNAAGVTGCRIIDSPRERLLAILTNSFVPCNGRFPTLIALITMFFIGAAGGFFASALSALLLTAVIVLGILITLFVTKALSKTLLRGVPSSYTLELPPYRAPQIGRVIVRSILDRTLFVLGRAAAVAAPAGLLIWMMANITLGGSSLLAHCSAFLDPFARLMGLDGVILMAFILGFPANEIVIPIIIMAYMASGTIREADSIWQMKELFAQNGWTWATALSVMVFSLCHWPCSTTLLTIKKETGSVKWTMLAALIPTAVGVLLCMLLSAAVRLFT